MTGAWRAFARLFAVQGAWNHERMQGQGIGWCSLPLLDTLDAAARPAAVARAAALFNGHPFLAGVVVGAGARAEADGAPAAKVERLRTAVAGPLGALGDQFFWSGLVPLLSAAALAAAVLGAGAWSAAGLVLAFALVRVPVTWWGLRLGLGHGVRVGTALASSWLPLGIALVGPAASAAVAAVLPLVVARGTGGVAPWMAAPALAGAWLLWKFPARVRPLRLAFAVAIVALLLGGLA